METFQLQKAFKVPRGHVHMSYVYISGSHRHIKKHAMVKMPMPAYMFNKMCHVTTKYTSAPHPIGRRLYVSVRIKHFALGFYTFIVLYLNNFN